MASSEVSYCSVINACAQAGDLRSSRGGPRQIRAQLFPTNKNIMYKLYKHIV